MAKSKNHTANNNSYKNHRNGIKKPKKYRFTSTKGKDPKFLKNMKYAKKGLLGKRHQATLARNAYIHRKTMVRKAKKFAAEVVVRREAKRKAGLAKDRQMRRKVIAGKKAEKKIAARLLELREISKKWVAEQAAKAPEDREEKTNIYWELGLGRNPKHLHGKTRKNARTRKRARDKKEKEERAKQEWAAKLILIKEKMKKYSKEERRVYRGKKRQEARMKLKTDKIERKAKWKAAVRKNQDKKHALYKKRKVAGMKKKKLKDNARIRDKKLRQLKFKSRRAAWKAAKAAK